MGKNAKFLNSCHPVDRRHTLLYTARGSDRSLTEKFGADEVSGLAEVSYVVMDEYGLPLGIPLRLLSGGSATWADELAVKARRNGYDLAGRVYQVAATLADVAGNTATVTAIIEVPHDRR